MKVAIAIVTYNGSRYIHKCLTSVLDNRYSDRLEIFVVDNNSQDDTVKIIKSNFPQVELIKLDSNLGFVGGNNIGIRRALERGADYVVLLNQDTEVEHDWLEKLVKVGETEPGAGIVQSMLLLANERALTNNVGNAMHYLGFGFVKHYRERVDSWHHRLPFAIGYASGAAMLVKREVLESVRLGFKTQPNGCWLNPLFFAYHEDLDLCWRARLAGYKIMIAPQSVVYHHYQFNRNKKMFYWTERNHWVCLLQNYSIKTLILISPMLLFTELAMLVYSLINSWFWQKIKSYFWLWVHLPQIFRQRRQVQAIRSVSDKEVMRHMESGLEFSEVDNFFLRRVVSPVVGWYYNKVLGN